MNSRDDIEDPTQDDYFPISGEKRALPMIAFFAGVIMWIAVIVAALTYGGVI